MAETSYDSDIIMGGEYQDTQTGFRGRVTSITFFEFACERVAIEAYDSERKKIQTEVFDAPRLKSIETEKVATAKRPGGPGMPNAQHDPRR